MPFTRRQFALAAAGLFSVARAAKAQPFYEQPRRDDRSGRFTQGEGRSERDHIEREREEREERRERERREERERAEERRRREEEEHDRYRR